MRLIIVDDMTPIRGMLRRRKLRIEDASRGELRRLADDPSTRKSFFASRGMRVDEAGEAMFDAGYLQRRPSPAEVLDLLAELLPSTGSKRQLTGVPVRIAELMMDGKSRTMWQIQTLLHIGHRCVCRDIRRLRGKTYGKLEIPVVRERGKWYYKFTPNDVLKAREIVPPPDHEGEEQSE